MEGEFLCEGDEGEGGFWRGSQQCGVLCEGDEGGGGCCVRETKGMGVCCERGEGCCVARERTEG